MMNIILLEDYKSLKKGQTCCMHYGTAKRLIENGIAVLNVEHYQIH